MKFQFNNSQKIIIFLVLFFGIFGLAKSSHAADIYIAQTAAGNNSGSDCANAHAATWFNASGNWANPKQLGKIGPGDIVHLCGTISNPMIVQASGSSASPITIYFEPSAKISMPACPSSVMGYPPSGCLDTNGNSWLVIDGGTPPGNEATCGYVNGVRIPCNGIIENTLNGTAGGICSGGVCTSQAWSNGLTAANCNNCEIKRLHIQNIYQRTSLTDIAGDKFLETGIWFTGNNISVHNNIVNDASSAMITGRGNDNVHIYQNDMYHNSHNLTTAGGFTEVGGSYYFHDNYVHFGNNDQSPWDNGLPGGQDTGYHQSAIHAWGSGNCPTGDKWTSSGDFWIYNNKFDQPGNWMSGWVFLEGGGQTCGRTPWTGATGRALIFNNVAIGSIIQVSNGTGHVVVNNTVIGSGDLGNLSAGSPTVFPSTAIIQNNYESGSGVQAGGGFSPTNVVGSAYNWDYNLYAYVFGYNLWSWSATTGSWATYKAQGGPWDTHSINDTCPWGSCTSANQGGVDQFTGIPANNSDVIDNGVNLTSFANALAAAETKPAGVAAANAMKKDINGNPRPIVAAWDIGAYEYVSGTLDTTPPANPTGLLVS